MIIGTNSIKKPNKQIFLTKNIFSDDTTGYGFFQNQWLYFKKYFIRRKTLKYYPEENRFQFQRVQSRFLQRDDNIKNCTFTLTSNF